MTVRNGPVQTVEDLYIMVQDEDIIVTPAMKAGLQKNSRSQTLPLMRGQKLKEV